MSKSDVQPVTRATGTLEREGGNVSVVKVDGWSRRVQPLQLLLQLTPSPPHPHPGPTRGSSLGLLSPAVGWGWGTSWEKCGCL